MKATTVPPVFPDITLTLTWKEGEFLYNFLLTKVDADLSKPWREALESVGFVRTTEAPPTTLGRVS